MPVFPRLRNPLFDLPARVLPTLAEILRGQPASVSRLGGRFLRASENPPRIENGENIPADTPFVLVFNHYESTRVAAWWAPLFASYVIAARRTHAPREPRFVMAEEWWYAGGWGRAVKQPLTRWFFRRAARVYGMVLVPPILEGFINRGEGTAGVRAALSLTRGDNPQTVGIAPEGRTGPGGALCEPPPGAGLFLLLLTHDTVPCLPMGVYEQDGVLTLKFGAPFQLAAPRRRARDERDRAAAARVMQELARLLPESLRGFYSTFG